MKIRFHSHACLSAETPQGLLLTDPWLFGEVFHRSWALRPEPAALELSRVRHVWISHAHPDHFHLPSLLRIGDESRGPLTVYYRKTADRQVVETLVKNGFTVVELHPGRETAIADGVFLTVFPTRNDSAAVLRLGDRVILNQNDCSLSALEVAAVKRMFPRIDAWFFQFSLAGWYANAGDLAGLEAARRHHLDLVAKYHAVFKPGIFVPFASFFYFCKEGNAFLNDWSITPAQLMAALPDLPTQLLKPGDELLWRDWQERNESNLAWWQDALGEPRRIRPHVPFPDATILAAAHDWLASLRARGMSRLGPREAQLEVRETGRVIAIDFRCGRAEMRATGDPDRIVFSAPAEELLFFLKSSHGADIFFSGCLDIRAPAQWWPLRRFRACETRAQAARWKLSTLDRQLLGGRLAQLRDWTRLGARRAR